MTAKSLVKDASSKAERIMSEANEKSSKIIEDSQKSAELEMYNSTEKPVCSLTMLLQIRQSVFPKITGSSMNRKFISLFFRMKQLNLKRLFLICTILSLSLSKNFLVTRI